MALKDITDKVSPVWQALKGIATGSKIISSEWNTVIENIAERTQYLRRRGVCDWDSTLSYSVGDYMQVSGVVYKALAANSNKAPTSNPTIWETCYLTKAEVRTAVDLLGYAPLASPALTGAPTAPTAAVDTSTTQVATTAFVTSQASATTPIVDGTAAVGSSKRYARADHVHPTDATRAPLASPVLTGTPRTPTAAVGTSTTQIANMAAVQAEFDAREYTSPELTITSGGTVTLTHGLGKLPKTVSVYLKCYTAEGGFAVGDITYCNIHSDPSGNNEGIGAIVTTTQIILRIGSNGIQNHMQKTNGEVFIVSDTNWKFFIIATA